MIALITFLHFNNYGTMLQAYALQRKIEELGFESEYIDYGGQVVASGFRKYLGHLKRVIISQFPDGKGVDSDRFFYTLRFRRFVNGINEFKKNHLNINRHILSAAELDNIKDSYEKFIVGSDQTWRVKNSDFYFLTFVDDNDKKIAYAPSLGTLHISDESIQILKRKIGSFKYLSCRERTNAVRLTQSFGREVEFVLDPTMLLSSDEWKVREKPYRGMPSQYILCYILGEKQCISDFAEQLGRQKNIPVYYIMTRPKYASKKHVIKDASPFQFISLVRNCSYMITDSFHGTIFSINLGVQFFAFNKREGGGSIGDNDRILEVLKEFDLDKRLCNEGGSYSDIPPIDYNRVQIIVNQLRTQSFDYLSRIVKN